MSKRMRNPNELFVGDLSFFCTEQHLQELFSTYGPVSEARIKRSDRGNRTLMYGFVRMEELKHALQAAAELNGKLYMGRAMRVQLSLTNTYYDSNVKNNVGFQVHVTITSRFPYGKAKDPHEGIIRDLLTPFGTIADVIIKEYKDHRDENKQIGYAFVTFVNGPEAKAATESCPVVEVDGVRFEFSLSRRAQEQINGSSNASNVIGSALGLKEDNSTDGETFSSNLNDQASSPTSQSVSSHQSKDTIATLNVHPPSQEAPTERKPAGNDFFSELFGLQMGDKVSINIQRNATAQSSADLGAPPGLIPRLKNSSPSTQDAQIQDSHLLGTSLDLLPANNNVQTSIDSLLFPQKIENTVQFPTFSGDAFGYKDSLLPRSPTNVYNVSPPMHSSAALDSLFPQDSMLNNNTVPSFKYDLQHSKIELQRVVDTMPYLSLQQVPAPLKQSVPHNGYMADRSGMNRMNAHTTLPPNRSIPQTSHQYHSSNQFSLSSGTQESSYPMPSSLYRDFPPTNFEDGLDPALVQHQRLRQQMSRPAMHSTERLDNFPYQGKRYPNLQMEDEAAFRNRLSSSAPQNIYHSLPYNRPSALHQQQQQHHQQQSHAFQQAKQFQSSTSNPSMLTASQQQHHHHQLSHQPQLYSNQPNSHPKYQSMNSSHPPSYHQQMSPSSNPHVYHATTATFRYQL